MKADTVDGIGWKVVSSIISLRLLYSLFIVYAFAMILYIAIRAIALESLFSESLPEDIVSLLDVSMLHVLVMILLLIMTLVSFHGWILGMGLPNILWTGSALCTMSILYLVHQETIPTVLDHTVFARQENLLALAIVILNIGGVHNWRYHRDVMLMMGQFRERNRRAHDGAG